MLLLQCRMLLSKVEMCRRSAALSADMGSSADCGMNEYRSVETYIQQYSATDKL